MRVREAAAVDAAAAHRALVVPARSLLMASVESPMLPADDPLLLLLVDQRRAKPRLNDNVWVRLLDLPVALTGRRYSAPLDVVLEVTDARLPANAGRWRLTTDERGPDGAWSASVVRTGADADLAIDVRELGAAYLGGRSIAAQAGAGLVVEQTHGAVQAAAAAFAWPVAPVCSWVF